jgi:hypothetical protein
MSNYSPISRLLATLALAGFLVALVVIAIVSASSGGGGETTTTSAARTTAPRRPARPTTTAPARPKTEPVKLTGTGAYDPEGDGRENDDLAPLAVDRKLATFWKTEHYLRGFNKSGVGLVLDAGRRRRISKVVVFTDAPGASAVIELGDAATGPFDPASAERTLNGRTAFPLTRGAAGRFVVVWITAVPEPAGEAHVNEVRATG